MSTNKAIRGSFGCLTMALVVGLIAACGGSGGSSSVTTSEASTGPCSSVQDISIPQARDYHTDKSYTAADYGTNPPAGGFHSMTFLDTPSINSPMKNLGTVVHTMDHGAVILWPSDKLSDQDNQTLLSTYHSLAAKSSFNPKDKYPGLVIVGNLDQEAPFAMTAWGYLQECDAVDAAAIESFVETYYASGPEGQAVACAKGSGGILKPPKVPACEGGT